MKFFVKPEITGVDTLAQFFEEWKVGAGDLIVTNEYVLNPALGGKAAPCDTLFQEKYGSGEPSDEMVDAMLAAIKGKDYKRIIAIGGGTVLDIAKLLTYGGDYDTQGLYDKGIDLEKKSRLIAIPTTCGTGSEVTGIAIVEFKKKGTKLGLAIPQNFCEEAVLIPAMLTTMPYDVFASSSIDALIHAVEGHVSPKANHFTRALGTEAIEMILKGYKKLTASGKRELPSEAELGDYLTASCLAGAAFANSGVAAVHALSYPIGGGYHVPHGKANYIVFAEVFAEYRTLNADLEPLIDVLARVLECPRDKVWDEMFSLLDKVLDRQKLADLGVTKEICAEMADSCIKNQQRLLGNNPVPLTQEQVESIYIRCM